MVRHEEKFNNRLFNKKLTKDWKTKTSYEMFTNLPNPWKRKTSDNMRLHNLLKRQDLLNKCIFEQNLQQGVECKTSETNENNETRMLETKNILIGWQYIIILLKSFVLSHL
jgi:hypothetical protein